MKVDKMTEHVGIKTGFNCKIIPFEICVDISVF